MKKKQYEVYIVTVEDAVLYVGQGKLGRHQHCLSGTSHVYGLNRLHFGGVYLTVNVIETFETKGDAEIRELDLIKALSPKFNTKFNGDANTVNLCNQYYLNHLCNNKRDDDDFAEDWDEDDFRDDDIDYFSSSMPLYFKQYSGYYTIDMEKNLFDINTQILVQHKHQKFYNKFEVETFCCEVFMQLFGTKRKTKKEVEEALVYLLKDCMYRIEYT